MDWMFYIYVFLVLFGIVAVLLSVRILMNRRIEKFEEKRRMEQEARQISETNSGL
jgi:flagellar biosynthesis/type III secretory pathway M-ring protein FliF/YscJ